MFPRYQESFLLYFILSTAQHLLCACPHIYSTELLFKVRKLSSTEVSFLPAASQLLTMFFEELGLHTHCLQGDNKLLRRNQD